MGKIKEYLKLQKKANQLFVKHESECAKMFSLIEEMLSKDIEDKNMQVFKQTGDGYVLAVDPEDYDRAPLNVPVIDIIKDFEYKKNPLTYEDLEEISI